jgi:hypothetical protein
VCETQSWSEISCEIPTLLQLLAFKDQYMKGSKGSLVPLTCFVKEPFDTLERSKI